MDEYFNAYHEMIYEESNNHNDDLYTEKQLTFGGKIYPKYNNVVIMAGGAGSGKGWQIANVLGIAAKILDVDKFKEFILKSDLMKNEIQQKYGINVNDFNLANSEDVLKLHEICKDFKLSERYQNIILNSIKEQAYKPNLIFDKTCKDISDLMKISMLVQNAGYKKENIHLVWVLNNYETAQILNSQRERQVSSDIINRTHRGTAITFAALMDNPNELKDILDGDVYINFNVPGIDTSQIINGKHQVLHDGKDNIVLKDATYVQVKKQGEPIINLKDLDPEIKNKIISYIPEFARKVWL